MTQRSSNVSYRTTGSPKLFVSHRLPKGAWLMNVLKVNAAIWAPVDLLKIPMDVLIVSMKWLGPTSPFVSGGCPAPQVAKSSPAKFMSGAGAGADRGGGTGVTGGNPL